MKALTTLGPMLAITALALCGLGWSGARAQGSVAAGASADAGKTAVALEADSAASSGRELAVDEAPAAPAVARQGDASGLRGQVQVYRRSVLEDRHRGWRRDDAGRGASIGSVAGGTTGAGLGELARADVELGTMTRL